MLKICVAWRGHQCTLVLERKIQIILYAYMAVASGSPKDKNKDSLRHIQ